MGFSVMSIGEVNMLSILLYRCRHGLSSPRIGYIHDTDITIMYSYLVKASKARPVLTQTPRRRLSSPNVTCGSFSAAINILNMNQGHPWLFPM